MERLVVAIMAKAPWAGEVKTRLCPPLSPPEAARLYRCFLLDKIAQVRTLQGATPAVAYTPPAGRAFFEAWAPGFVLIPQGGADLGSRLAQSFDQLFARGYAGALAIDADTPTLPAPFLQQALDLIARPDVDLVLGPSEDGGYYLMGVRTVHRELFEDMPWSTDRVFAETVRRAEARGLKVACLPSWFDVDRPGDLDRLQAALAGAEGTVPRHTRRFFMKQAG